MLEHRVGELAGLATAALWVVSSLSFTAAGRRIGATRLNLLRTLAAAALLSGVHLAATGHVLPDVGWEPALWLATSGILGLTIGDQFLFTAYVMVGPRSMSLLMTLVPSMSAILSLLAFRQGMGWWSVAGMAVTTAGVAWVVAGGRAEGRPVPRDVFVKGLWLGIGAAACQAIGLVLSKQGLEKGLTPLGALVCRMDAAAITIIPLAAWTLRRAEPLARGAVQTATWPMALGVLSGPLLGVYCSMVAVDRLPVGVAATLTQLVPVFILPVSRFLHAEPISTRAFTGAIIAVAGVAMLAADNPAPGAGT